MNLDFDTLKGFGVALPIVVTLWVLLSKSEKRYDKLLDKHLDLLPKMLTSQEANVRAIDAMARRIA